MITYPIHLVRTYYIGMQIPCLEFPSNYEVTFEISLIAELGGYMGLLLGISLMDISSIMNYIIDYFYSNAQCYRK